MPSTRSGERGIRKGGLPHASPRSDSEARSGAGEAGLRVVVATAPTLSRESLCRALGAEPGLLVLGPFPPETDLAMHLARSKPRVLLFDYEVLGPNPEALIFRLHRGAPLVRILVLSARSDSDTVERVLRAGASGLIDKESDLAMLVRAIRSVARGEVWANRKITAQTLEHLTDFTSHEEGDLTPREVEIVDWVGRGLRNREIADRLKINEKTVKSHLNNIFRKLRVDTRIELALREHPRLGPKA